jgi:hypothetical protein
VHPVKNSAPISSAQAAPSLRKTTWVAEPTPRRRASAQQQGEVGRRGVTRHVRRGLMVVDGPRFVVDPMLSEHRTEFDFARWRHPFLVNMDLLL